MESTSPCTVAKTVVINEILQGIRETAQELWNGEEDPLNALVVLDEAHNFAPAKTDEPESRELKETLELATIETRKFHLGWMFISTTMSGLSSKLVGQLRMLFLGHGVHSVLAPRLHPALDELISRALTPKSALHTDHVFLDSSDRPRRTIIKLLPSPILFESHFR